MLQVVDGADVFAGVDVLDTQDVLDTVNTLVGQDDRLALLVDFVIAGFELAHRAGELGVRIARRDARSTDDKGRTGFVDEDGVGLVHDGEVQIALAQLSSARTML